ncbi:3551_t:CDS:2 [Ambispora leptoticha]|uniref:3551_t:CDS:1 n=1 Tax=Ambispora leptoticha TaxID=144679 RepID=A0A9N8ZKE5_9GLOM|nr:3551_t:CDS:2 [Ambispora leptoticha]
MTNSFDIISHPCPWPACTYGSENIGNILDHFTSNHCNQISIKLLSFTRFGVAIEDEKKNSSGNLSSKIREKNLGDDHNYNHKNYRNNYRANSDNLNSISHSDGSYLTAKERSGYSYKYGSYEEISRKTENLEQSNDNLRQVLLNPREHNHRLKLFKEQRDFSTKKETMDRKQKRNCMILARNKSLVWNPISKELWFQERSTTS